MYVVDAAAAVSVRKVALGPGNATECAITDGLKPGEMVVIDGADKLKDGAKVLLREPKAPRPARAAAADPGRASTGTARRPGRAGRSRRSAPPASRAAG